MGRVESKWSVGARSETGYVRSENQDRMSRVRAQFGAIYVVADGIGGQAGGGLAAELTVKAIQDRLSNIRGLSSIRDAVKGAFESANKAVYEEGHSGNTETKGMGATVVTLLTAGSRVMVAHVGDSRAYLFTRGGQLRRLTRDHSRVQRMVDAGMLTAEEAQTHPEANIIDRAIGLGPTVDVEIGSWLRLRDGDKILLCSDGLCGYAEDSEIAAVLGQEGHPKQLVNELVKLALAKGGEDNVTVQLIRYGSPTVGRIWDRLRKRFAIFCVAVGLPGITGVLDNAYLHSRLDALSDRVAALQQEQAEWVPQVLERASLVEIATRMLGLNLERLAIKVAVECAVGHKASANSARKRHSLSEDIPV
jgi:serine/threonine protein phosphatase PrpC